MRGTADAAMQHRCSTSRRIRVLSVTSSAVCHYSWDPPVRDRVGGVKGPCAGGARTACVLILLARMQGCGRCSIMS